MKYRVEAILGEYARFKLGDINGLPVHTDDICFYIDVTGETLAEHANQLSDVLATFTIVPSTDAAFAQAAANAQETWSKWIPAIKASGEEAVGEFIFEGGAKVCRNEWTSLSIDPVHNE